MNKITIPALLLGVVMIAGAFAFMPVQEASTVHTTVQGTQVEVQTLTLAVTGIIDASTDAVGTLTCNAPYLVHSVNVVTAHDSATDDFDALLITVDGESVTGLTTTNPSANADIAENIVLNVGAVTDANTVFTQGASAAASTTDDVTLKAAFSTTSDATCTLT